MIPPNRECDYCLDHYQHGGKCFGIRKSHSTPCLGFKQDPRGCIKFDGAAAVFLSVGKTIPKLCEWTDRYEFDGKDVEIKFVDVSPREWKMTGQIGLKCDAKLYYFDNSEFGEQGEIKSNIVQFRRRHDD